MLCVNTHSCRGIGIGRGFVESVQGKREGKGVGLTRNATRIAVLVLVVGSETFRVVAV